MKFSVNWLRQLVDISCDVDTLAARLTLSGLEVAGIETIGASLDGVIVARIVECAVHPDADRLRVCRVETGRGELRIVCGAPNARAGLIAPLATIGTRMPGGAVIETAKLRGIESSGMLCSANELGVDADGSGLLELPADAPIGARLAEYLGLPDTAIDVDLTPNRGDCLGMLGLADEVAAEFGARPKPFEPLAVPVTIEAPREIRLEAGADCPRYLGRAVRGIDPAARTPVWMAQRLRAAGVRTVGAVVDVTNYVMLETGQPLHAFDEDKLDGALVVRRAREGEVLKLLDGSDATLDPAFMVIANESGALAVAGVMGGLDSRVVDTTRNVFLEAAHFGVPGVIGKARRLGVASDAAFRFERGVDPDMPRIALERATQLLLEIAGAQAGEVLEAVLPGFDPRRPAVPLRRTRIARVLGAAVADHDVERILKALGMTVGKQDDGWRVTPPTRRFDVEREEDLIEEVARIQGYDAIPAGLPAGAPPTPHADESVLSLSLLTDALASRGYHEAVCYAFVDRHLLEAWHQDAGVVALANPLSADMAVMRTSLLPGLTEALKRNRNRQQTRVRLFETGVVFRQWGAGSAESKAAANDNAPAETAMVAAVAYGAAHAEQWGTEAHALDFFDIKGDLEASIALSGVAETWSLDASDLPLWLHPGRGARVLRDGVVVGAVGALHPALLHQLELPETYVFEIRADALRQRTVPRVDPLAAFPSLRRDIAVEVDEAVAWERVAAALRAGLPTTLSRLVLFDCYRGAGLGAGRKSLAIGLILQDSSRTLTDEDADGCVAAAVKLLQREFGAVLRG